MLISEPARNGDPTRPRVMVSKRLGIVEKLQQGKVGSRIGINSVQDQIRESYKVGTSSTY